MLGEELKLVPFKKVQTDGGGTGLQSLCSGGGGRLGTQGCSWLLSTEFEASLSYKPLTQNSPTETKQWMNNLGNNNALFLLLCVTSLSSTRLEEADSVSGHIQ